MSIYSVAEAQDGLAGLIDRALAGDEVIITREGLPVVEIRPTSLPNPGGRAAFYDWLASRRSTLKGPPFTSVELLDLIYDEPEP